MKREILFRGKRMDGKGWVEGGIVLRANGQIFIAPIVDASQIIISAVDPSTVGQYTGLTDRNGLTKIFEYDIIDANGRKVGNYYENSNLLKDGTCFLVARMGTKEWSRSEQEAIKRGCKYAE